MAHFAELDENNIVTRVIVVHNDELLVDGVESEQKGIDFCVAHYGGTWVQTSYNRNFRKNFAGINAIYDPIRDAFIYEKPFPSWVLNEDTCHYEPPVDYPVDYADNFQNYFWNEETLAWVEIE